MEPGGSIICLEENATVPTLTQLNLFHIISCLTSFRSTLILSIYTQVSQVIFSCFLAEILKIFLIIAMRAAWHTYLTTFKQTCLTFHRNRSIIEVEVEVNLRPTVSRPVCLGVRHPSGTRNQFFFLIEISFRQLRFVI
jgi:hypothetical protein